MELTEAEVLKAASDFDAGIVDDGAGKDLQAIEGNDQGQAVAGEGDQPAKESGKDEGTEGEEGSSDNETTDQGKKAEDGKDGKQESKFAKEKTRQGKTWAEINAQKEALKQERERLDRERSEWQRQREEASKSQVGEFRDKNGHTAEEYESAAKTFEAQGEDELAKQALKAAKETREAAQAHRMQAEQDKFNKTWADNYAKLAEKREWLKDQNSDNYKRAVDLLTRYPVLRGTPDGINHAVELIELQDQAASASKLKGEVDSLRKELETLRKKTAIGGGKPTTGSKAEKPFEKLSLKEQEAQLNKLAREFDAVEA